MEACRRLGIQPKELTFHSIDDYLAKNNGNLKLAKLQYEFYEDKWKDLLVKAVGERMHILQQLD